MRKVQCEECGKRYDFDIDDFCPRCGAFNQPARTSRIGSSGQVIRIDGINESNHGGSFVHRELHQEDKARRRKGLEQPQKRTPAAAQSQSGTGRESYQRTYQKTYQKTYRNDYQKARGQKGKLPPIVKAILVIFAINIIATVVSALGDLLMLW